MVILQEPIAVAYETVQFIAAGESKIHMNESTIKFWLVSYKEAKNNLTLLRGFIGNIITNLYESRNWQSAVYLYGAPEISESVPADLIKRLIPPVEVHEFNRHQNQCSIGQLAHCQILIVSDLPQIKNKQVEILKRVLRCDTLTHERTSEFEFGVISPTCQVLITSNKKRTEFTRLDIDQAILDKLIKVYLGPELQIRAETKTPNIAIALYRSNL